MPDGKTTLHYRTVRDTPIVSFEKAKLQNTSWKGTELTKVNGKGETVPAVSFANADISNADFSEALIDGVPVKVLVENVLKEDIDSIKSSQVLKNYFCGSRYSLFKAPNITGAFIDLKTADILQDKIFDMKG